MLPKTETGVMTEAQVMIETPLIVLIIHKLFNKKRACLLINKFW